jgi:large subunit ribosomal protein L22
MQPLYLCNEREAMEVRSIYKYARISPFKVREVTREIQGLPVSAALDLLAFTPKKAAFLINKTLKSAIANAENNANLKPDGLVVKEAVVGEGPTFKRMMARARGSGSRILKRTSHIRIVLSDEIQIETRETRKKKRQQEKKESRKQATSEETAEKPTTAKEKTPKAKKSAGKKAKK